MRGPLLLLMLLPVWAFAGQCPALLQHELPALRSQDRIDLCGFAGKPLIIVNTASFCGYTPQFEGLESVYQRYREQGLEVLGVPSNDFRQEARDQAAIAEVCYVNYGVTFRMSEPQVITGKRAHPLYRALAEQAGERPRWNFHKYIVGRDGQVKASFPSAVSPDDPRFIEALEKAL